HARALSRRALRMSFKRWRAALCPSLLSRGLVKTRRSPKKGRNHMTDVSKKYTPRTYSHLKGLKGISDGVLEVHFKLYEGYVNRTNKLTETLMGLAKQGQAAGTNPAYTEMTRRLGFEYNGMVLHEYYFENMKPNGSGQSPSGALKTAIEGS